MKTSACLRPRILQRRVANFDRHNEGQSSNPSHFMTSTASRSSRVVVAVVAFFCTWTACTLGMPVTALAELTVLESDEDDGRLTIFKLSVTPAGEPVPALKHRLMLREIDLRQGNAAPYYYRTLLGVPAARKATTDRFGDEYHVWYSTADVSLDELPLEKVREAVGFWSGSVMHNLRTAAQRRECNWEWNLEEVRGLELIQFLLEEIQECRSLSRALMLQVRLALAENRTADAIDVLRLNFQLSRDVAREPLLICDLVGIAIASMGNLKVIELIAQPGSPNLYWALTELPRPLIDIRDTIRAEMSLGLRTFPFILDAETAEHSPQEWSRLLAQALIDSQSLMSNSMGVPDDQMTLVRAGVAGMALFAYPHAKQRLIDGGMDPAQVENMPVGKVIAIDSLHEYRRIADDLEKWHYIPYRTMRSRNPPDPLHDQGRHAATVLTSGYGYTLAATLLPAIRAARSAEERLLWQMDGIRTVEAVRMHAAVTGQLPRSLSEIEIVPVPENPATGEPFDYTLAGDTAVLDLPFSDGFRGVAWRFEITLKK